MFETNLLSGGVNQRAHKIGGLGVQIIHRIEIIDSKIFHFKCVSSQTDDGGRWLHDNSPKKMKK